MKTGKSQSILLLIAALVFLQAGCGPSGYRGPISKFQSASAVVIASARLYFNQLNKVERDKYILEQQSKPEAIKLNALMESEVFSEKGINARMEALDRLVAYGDLLSRLANSDAPARIKASAVDLNTAISNLSQTVSGLTGTDDAQFRSAAGPVTTIVSEILDLIIQQKIKNALDKAIQNGEKPINDLLAVIGSDLTIAYQRRRNSFSALRVSFVDEYNLEAAKGPNADREKLRELARRLREHEDVWEAFGRSNPRSGLDAMARAHSALLTYARSAHKVTELASLVEAMEAFAARAAIIGQAVQELRSR